jgi:hypothetical protein
MEFLRTSNFFSVEQYGFLENRSTTTQLITTLNDFYISVQKGLCVDVIYIDFAKAFDSVPISILLLKLKNIGIDGKIYKFIENFLTNRSFKVKICESFSESKNTYSGVPQGSVLGPMLFIIFINDIVKIIPEGVKIKIFADDIKLYIEHNNDTSSKNTLKQALDSISKWSKDNAIDISKNKCFALYIGKKNSKEPYFIDKELIQSTESIRDLGVIIDKDLSFSQHISKIIQNAYMTANQLLKILKTRNLKTLILAYKTYVRPHLEYATEVWNPSKKCGQYKIERVQKFFTRISFKKCGLLPIPYQKRLKLCNLDTLVNRRIKTDMVMTYKVLDGRTQLRRSNFFTLAKRYRRRTLYLQPRIHPKKSRNNFFNRVVSHWNKIPNIEKGLKINTFRKFINGCDFTNEFLDSDC